VRYFKGLLFLFAIVILGAVLAAPAQVSSWRYSISGGQAYIGSGTYQDPAIDRSTSGDLIIPSDLSGYPVVGIRNSAFWSCTNLTSIVVPDTVTSIASDAFANCVRVRKVVIPDSVQGNLERAMMDCDALEYVRLPSGMKQLGGQILTGSYGGTGSLKTLVIPKGVTSIGGYAFWGQVNLDTIVIPSGVTTIGGAAFYYCNNLSRIVFLGNAPSVESSTFTVPSSKATVYVTSKWTASRTTWNGFTVRDISEINKTITTHSNGDADVVQQHAIPLGAMIGMIDEPYRAKYAFSGWYTAADGGTEVGYWDRVTDNAELFAHWTPMPTNSVRFDLGALGTRNGGGALEQTVHDGEAAVEPSVQPKSGWQFAGWSSDFSCVSNSCVVYAQYVSDDGCYKQSFTGDRLWSYEVVADGACLRQIHATTPIAYPALTDCLNIPTVIDGLPVVAIGDNAFVNQCGITNAVTIPKSVVRLGLSAFRECRNIPSIQIAGDLQEIPYNCFNSCTALERVTIPATVTNIRDYAFAGCRSLQKPVLPSGLKSIGRYAFSGCDLFDAVCLPASLAEIDSTAYYNCTNLYSVSVSGDSANYSSYEGILYTKNYYQIVIVPPGIVSATLAQGVRVIQSGTFFECKKLKAISFPASLVSIDNCAFKNCPELATVDFINPSRLISLRVDYAFASTPYLDSLPDGLVIVKDVLISRKGTLADEVEIPETCREIARSAFADDSAIKRVIIPGSVCEIKDRAFEMCVSLESILLPSTITNIGNCAFLCCSSLSSITIPAATQRVGESAFNGCAALKSVTIQNGVKEIGNNAFQSCSSLKSIYLPASVSLIRSHVFNGCTALERIDVAAENEQYFSYGGALYRDYKNGINFELLCAPQGIESIVIFPGTTHYGVCAFNGCGKLTSVRIPAASINYFYSYAFTGCTNLSEVVFETPEHVAGDLTEAFAGTAWWKDMPDGIVYADDVAIGYKGDDSSVINVAADCVAIRRGAFSGMHGIRSAAISSSVRRIYEDAFFWCTNLESLTIAEGVTNIGNSAFSQCKALTTVTIPSTVERLGQSAFYGCDALSEVYVANGVKTLEWHAFGDCISLERINIPASVVSIYDSVFEGCVSLKSIDVDAGNDNYTSLNGVLYDKNKWHLICSPKGITSVEIPASVTYIGASAFEYCNNITEVIIPDTVQSIGDGAFANCASLTNVVVPAGVACNYNSVFAGTPFLERRPSGLVIVDNVVVGVSGDCPDEIEIPDGVIAIGEKAFEGCESLQSISFPQSLRKIEYGAFWYCNGLTEVALPDSLAEIGYNVFGGCENLTSVYLPNGIEFVENALFHGCRSLEEIRVSENNPLYVSVNGCIYNRAQTRLLFVPKSASELNVPDGVEEIGDSAVSYCESLETLTLPECLEKISSSAFYGCSSLSDFTIPESVNEIGSGSFDQTAFYLGQGNGPVIKDGCLLCYKGTQPSSVSIPSGVRLMAQGAINIYLLESIVIPGSMTKIPANAFSGAQKLKSVVVQAGVAVVGDWAFNFCRELTSVSLPASIESFGSYVFQSCDKLVTLNVENGGTALSKSGGVTWDKINKRIVFIDKDATSVSLPEGVTQIADSSMFSGCNALTSLTIPSTVTYISSYVLNHGCPNLASVEISAQNKNYKSENGIILNKAGTQIVYAPGSISTLIIPEGVAEISYNAFAGNTNITAVVLPSTLKSIREGAFNGCSALASFNIPVAVETIGRDAFLDTEWWNSLVDGLAIKDSCVLGIKGAGVSSVVIPAGVRVFAESVFRGNQGLVNVTIGEGVAVIPNYMFWGCSALSSVEFPSSLREIQYSAFYGCKSLSSLNLKNVEVISSEAFYGCSSLTSVTLPSSLRNLSWNAFGGCEGLKAVVVQTEQAQIAKWAFTDCPALKSFIVPSGNKAYAVTDGVLYSKDMSRLLAVPNCANNLVIPETVSSIADYACYGCSGLESLILPTSLVDPEIDEDDIYGTNTYYYGIGRCAFQDCSGLKEIIVPSGISYIPYCAFMNCSTMTNAVLPESVKRIDYMAFAGCTSLETVTIPGALDYLGDDAFADTKFLEEREDGVVVIGGCVVRVNGECPAEVVIPPGTKSIAGRAFLDCHEIESIVIPESVKSIGDEAFSCCLNLKHVTLPSVEMLGAYMFAGCESLGAIEIPETVRWMGQNVFEGCHSLTNVVLHDGIGNIGYYAFADCTALRALHLPTTVSAIDYMAFAGCVALESVNIPDSVTSVYPESFDGCVSLIDDLTYSGLKVVDGWIVGIDDGEALDFLTIPNGIRGIAQNVFCGYGSLLSVSIPGSVKTISYGVFSQCSGLLSVEMANGVQRIEGSAFSGCRGLVSISIPQSVGYIANGAFAGTPLVESCVAGPVVVDGCVIDCIMPCASNIILPEGVRLIADGLFSYSSIESISFPSSYGNLNPQTIVCAESLEYVYVHNPDAALHSMSFLMCTNLHGVVMRGKKPGHRFVGWMGNDGQTDLVLKPNNYYSYYGQILPEEDYWLYPVWEECEDPTPEEEIKDALDDENLDWDLGTGASWFAQDLVTYDGVSAAQSGAIGNATNSTLRTVVAGPGKLSFFWKVSSEENKDKLNFYLDGEGLRSISGEQDWELVEVVVEGDCEHELKWVYSKSKSGVSGSDCGWLDSVCWKPEHGGDELTLGEALDAESLTWMTSGAADWYGVGDKTTHYAISGEVEDGEESVLSTSVSGSGTITFTWRTSCEDEYDGVEFYVDGVVQRWITGETDWKTISLQLEDGDHLLEWVYYKDEQDTAGADSGYLKEVCWDPDTKYAVTNVSMVGAFPWHDGNVSVDYSIIGDTQEFGSVSVEIACANDGDDYQTITSLVSTAYTDQGDHEYSFNMFDFFPGGGSANMKVACRLFNGVGLVAEMISSADMSMMIPIGSVLDAPKFDFEIGGDTTIAWMPDFVNSAIGGSSLSSTWGMGSSENPPPPCSTLQCSVQGAGTLEFRLRKVGADPLVILVDGCEIYRTTNETGWVRIGIPVSGLGNHTIRWEFVSNGGDTNRIWLDGISWGNIVTPVAPTDEWWNEHAELLEKLGGVKDYMAASPGSSGSGKLKPDGSAMTIWEDYVAGTNPENEDDRFKASIAFDDQGKPVVTWTPALNGEGVKTGVRTYTTYGTSCLGGVWTEVLPGDEAKYNFFRVSVEVP